MFQSVLKVFPCCNPTEPSKVELLIEEVEADEDSHVTELIQQERSLELQIIQAEQKLSAYSLVSKKTASKLKELEDTLQVSTKRQISSQNSQLVQDKTTEIESLKEKQTRLDRKTRSLQKYRDSILAEEQTLAQFSLSQENALVSMAERIRELSKEMERMQSETETARSAYMANENTSKDKTIQINQLKNRKKDLEAELAFAQSMKSKMENTVNVPTVPSRRGRPRPLPVQPPEEEKNSVPSLPARGTSSLADRMKMFQ